MSRFLGDTGFLYLNFRGAFTNLGDTKSFKFLPFKLNSYPEISVFLFKFELDVDNFGSRSGVDDRLP